MQHPNHVRKIYQNLDLIIIKRTAHCLMEYIEQLSIFSQTVGMAAIWMLLQLYPS